MTLANTDSTICTTNSAIICIVKTECNGTRTESRFGLPAKRTSPFMLLVVFMLDSDYSPFSVTTNNINGLVRFAGRPNLLSACVPLHSVFTLQCLYYYNTI